MYLRHQFWPTVLFFVFIMISSSVAFSLTSERVENEPQRGQIIRDTLDSEADNQPQSRATLGTVVNTGKRGRFLRVLCDQDGDIHLCYWRNYAIYYYRQHNGIWQSEIMVSGSDSADGRHYPDFAIEEDGRAHFIWNVGSILNKIRYNSYNDGTWSGMVTLITTSSSGNPAVCRPAITVCPNGTVYVSSQHDDATTGTQYLFWAMKSPGGAWQTPADHICFQSGTMPYKPSMDCGSNNYPVVLFSHFNNSYLGYNQSTGVGPDYWPNVIDPTGSMPGIPDGTDIFIDHNNHAHITWIQWVAGGPDFSKIGYNYRNGPNYNSPWSTYRTLYQQNDIVIDEVTVPDPRVAANVAGAICVVYGHFVNTSNCTVRYILKEPGQAWPTYSYPEDVPPKINDTALQSYASVCVDPVTDDFIVAWEENPANNPGNVYYRRIMLTQTLDPPVLTAANYFNGKIYLNWTAPSDPQGTLDHYNLYRSVDSGPFSVITSTQDLFYIDADCWGGSTFAYKATSVDVIGRESAFSNTLEVYIEQVPTLSQAGLVILLLGLSVVLVRTRRLNLIKR